MSSTTKCLLDVFRISVACLDKSSITCKLGNGKVEFIDRLASNVTLGFAEKDLSDNLFYLTVLSRSKAFAVNFAQMKDLNYGIKEWAMLV